MLFEDKIFEKTDFTQKPLPKGEYEYCRFLNCDFSHSNLSECRFLECEFSNCNLSMAKLGMTVFRDVQFNHCKMLGLNFEHCSEFGFSARWMDCSLNHSSFFKRKLKNMPFKDCRMIETDFTDADLTGCIFENCDFSNAKFENTVLEQCDFSQSYHFNINPEINRLKKARFSLNGLPGLLSQYGIEVV